MTTHRVELDDEAAGPLFRGASFGEGVDEVHDWVARNHPGRTYAIVTNQPGRGALRVSYWARPIRREA